MIQETIMLIPIIYLSGKHDMVKDHLLADLIEQRKILSFKRRDGWVNAAGSNIRRRSSQCNSYRGPERRQHQACDFNISFLSIS
jgi:hypothetical protein